MPKPKPTPKFEVTIDALCSLVRDALMVLKVKSKKECYTASDVLRIARAKYSGLNLLIIANACNLAVGESRRGCGKVMQVGDGYALREDVAKAVVDKAIDERCERLAAAAKSVSEMRKDDRMTEAPTTPGSPRQHAEALEHLGIAVKKKKGLAGMVNVGRKRRAKKTADERLMEPLCQRQAQKPPADGAVGDADARVEDRGAQGGGDGAGAAPPPPEAHPPADAARETPPLPTATVLGSDQGVQPSACRSVDVVVEFGAWSARPIKFRAWPDERVSRVAAAVKAAMLWGDIELRSVMDGTVKKVVDMDAPLAAAPRRPGRAVILRAAEVMELDSDSD